MFYKSQRLDQFLTSAQRELVEHEVNQWIHDHGHVIYGNMSQDNNLSDFTSDKKPTDFWVGFAIGLKLMGSAEKSRVPAKVRNEIDVETQMQAALDKAAQLEKQLRQRDGKV